MRREPVLTARSEPGASAGRGKAAWLYALAALVTVLLVWGAVTVTTVLAEPNAVDFPDLRPLLLCASLVGLSCLPYLAWPSWWNIPAHSQLAFSVVAYIVPIWSLGRLNGLTSEALDTYYQVCVAGFAISLVAVLIGRSAANFVNVDRLRARANFDSLDTNVRIARRVFVIALLSCIAVVLAFAYMRMVPAFADDPFAAKFFRGPYADRYAPVAPLYRAGTSALTLLMPLIVLFAWKIRTPAWVMLFATSAGVMFLGLQRQPAVTGLLLILGVWFAVRKKGMWVYVLGLIAVYFIGGALYFFLTKLGIDGYAITNGSGGILAEAAAGAPDVSDQVTFLTAWLKRPEYTNGLTFIGGLVPSNYYWNPSVWSLHVVNPTVPISQISSGGLRIPAPIWGLVSFGWPGVVLVSAVSAFFIGFLGRLAGRVVPSSSGLKSTYWIVLYVASLSVVPVFFRLSYLSVLQLVIVFAILFVGTKKPLQRLRQPRWVADRVDVRRLPGSAGPTGAEPR